MTLTELYLYCLSALQFGGCAEFETMCIFEDLLGLSGQRALLDGREADGKELSLVKSAVKRRQSGEPLQYILGKWDFYDMTFYVGDGVLIPRPETELLIDFAVDRLRDIKSPVIYDLCAGSGCIGLTLAKHLPDATVYLVEKENKAFEYLKKNRELHGLENAVLINGDIFTLDISQLPSADILLSNPPYIPTGEIARLQTEVLREPISALDGGGDGLLFFRCFADRWCDKVKKGGFIAFENDKNQSEDIIRLFNGKYMKKNVIFDFNDIDRIVTFRI